MDLAAGRTWPAWALVLQLSNYIGLLVGNGGWFRGSRRALLPRQGAWKSSLREVLVGMIEEYARHMGHVDLLWERIGGRIGQ